MLALTLKIALGIVLVAATGILIIWVLGSRLPREHVASRAIVFSKAAPSVVWGALADYAGQIGWRSNLKANVRQPDQNGHEVWRNEMKNGDSLTLEIAEAEPLGKLVTKIVNSGGPFGGRWIYQVTPENGGSRLRITEEGWVNPVMFRAIGRYFIGYETTINTFMKDLAKHLHEEAAPQPSSPDR